MKSSPQWRNKRYRFFLFMKHSVKKILSERWYIFSISIILLYFFLQGIFFAFSIRQGVYPDENYHLVLISLYYKSHGFFVTHSPETYFLGPIQHLPYLYHLLAGKLLHLNIFPIADIYFLRLLSVLINFGTVVFAFLTFTRATKNKLVHVLALGMLTNFLYYTFMSASTTYDVLVNFFAMGSIYFLFSFFQKKRGKGNSLFFFFSFLFLGSLTKYTFLPLATILVIILLPSLFQKNIRTEMANIKFSKKIVFSSIFLLILIILNLNIYGYNLLHFKNIIPKCTDELTHEQCLNNIFYSSELYFSTETENHAFAPVSYFFEWKDLMGKNISGIYALQGFCKNEQEYDNCQFKSEDSFSSVTSIYQSELYRKFFTFLIAILPLLILFEALTNILRIHAPFKQEKMSAFIPMSITIILFYSIIVLYANFSAYYSTGTFAVTIHGRYLFPVLPLMCLVLSFFLLNYLSKKIAIFFTAAFVMFMFWNGLPLFIQDKQSSFIRNGKYESLLPQGSCSAKHPICGDLDPEEWAPCASENIWQCLIQK